MNNKLKAKSIALKIKKFTKESKLKGAVIGLSGGIDSSVCLALLVKALGKDKVLAISMHENFQKEEIKDSKELAKQFKVKFKEIQIEPILKAFLKTNKKSNKLSTSNLKARIRMSILYHYANNLNYFVCGTGNKSELMLGYFTKYGDGGNDLLPIGNLYKWQVSKIAKELDIPLSIIIKEPSANLYLGQSDEKEIGFSYSKIDEVLAFFEKHNPTQSSLKKAENKFGKKISNKILKLMQTNKHKLKTPEVIK